MRPGGGGGPKTGRLTPPPVLVPIPLGGFPLAVAVVPGTSPSARPAPPAERSGPLPWSRRDQPTSVHVSLCTGQCASWHPLLQYLAALHGHLCGPVGVKTTAHPSHVDTLRCGRPRDAVPIWAVGISGAPPRSIPGVLADATGGPPRPLSMWSAQQNRQRWKRASHR